MKTLHVFVLRVLFYCKVFFSRNFDLKMDVLLQDDNPEDDVLGVDSVPKTLSQKELVTPNEDT